MKISAVCDDCRKVHPMKQRESGRFYYVLLKDGWLIGTTRVLCPECNKGKQ